MTKTLLPFHEHNPDVDPLLALDTGKTILLEQDVRDMTAEHLRELGFRVLEADSGGAALRILQAGAQLDLLVSDIGLPGGMNGRQVAGAVRLRHPGLPVILMTGYAPTDLTANMKVLRKPFEAVELTELVRANLKLVANGRSSVTGPPSISTATLEVPRWRCRAGQWSRRWGAGTLPRAAPIAFIRRGWRPFVMDADGKPDRRAWEVCVLSELRNRLRAGDVWVYGSRRYRNFEDCLLPKPTFAALRAEGPLPVGVAEDAAEYLALRRTSVANAMADVTARAGSRHAA